MANNPIPEKHQNNPAQKKIRIGFFQFDGYHLEEKESNGKIRRSGYGYDLLQMLLPYVEWNYEYIGYTQGWTEMLPMLENGKIDLVTSAVKIPEKETKFDFSTRSIGYSSVIMTVKAGSRRFLSHDYEHWNGIKVGLLQGNSKNDVFAKFAKTKGFRYEEVFFTKIDEMYAALQNEQIDSIVTGSLRRLQNEWLFEQLDVRPFYVIVKKGNQQLLKEVNTALEKLEMDYPGFANVLHKKYYDHNAAAGGEVSFTLEEQTFINRCQESNRKFRVLVNPDRFPFSYFEQNEFKGIMRTLMDTIGTRSGLDFMPIFCRNRQEYYDYLHRRDCDLVLDMSYDFSQAEQNGYILTPPYLTAAISRISRKSYSGIMDTCGIVEGSNMANRIRRSLPTTYRFTEYPNQEAVIEAVKKGRVSAGYIFGRTAENAILNDRRGLLAIDPTGYPIQFALGTNKNLDRQLINILCKTVRSFSEEEIQEVLLADNLRLYHNTFQIHTFRDIIMENPLKVSLFLIGLVLLLSTMLAISLIYHRRADQATALLTKNSRMWKLLLNTLPIHIFAKDATNGFRYIFNNRAREDFFGITIEDLNGMDDYSLLSKEMAEQRRQEDINLTSAGQGRSVCSLQLRGNDGLLHYLYSILVPFTHSDGTKLILGCSIDQTELEEARRNAEENAERLHKTLISIGDGVLTTDREGRITLLNPVAEKMLGTTLSESRGKSHTDFFQIQDYQNNTPKVSPVEHCLTTGEIVVPTNHTDLISRDGSRYHIADSAAPIRDKTGAVVGSILVFRDMTQEYDLRNRLLASTDQLRDALEQAQRASSAKGIFLSQMSHEIRTPLNAIIGYLNIAQEKNCSMEKTQECLAKGFEASSHLLSIINNILDISAIESGKFKIGHEDFDFKRLLTGIVSMFYNQAEAKKIKFEIRLTDLTEEWLIGDSLRVNQILLNLLSNAMKFTQAGGSVTLTVKQLAMVQNRVQLMFQVKDTGCGMKEEFKSRLFLPFEQQDASTARRFGGTGLGLSITKNLIDMMGGTLEVESRENEGTTFSLSILFDKSSRMETRADVDFSKIRALIADDREEDRTYIQMILKKCGVKSDVVESGEAAVRQLERRLDSRHPYDICLLDQRFLSSGGMDGIETARTIRNLKGFTQNLPIILITAYDTAAISQSALQAGVNKIIQKPLFQSTFFDFLMNTHYHVNEKNNTEEAIESLRGLHILLVEDNQMNMDISTQYLERAGMKITPAWNGQEAVDLFVNSPPETFQAILMDIQMPVMDGYKATETIRACAHPKAKSIPIIAMTANAFNEDIVKALHVGMNDHIAKPIFYDRLFDSLSKLTQKKVLS